MVLGALPIFSHEMPIVKLRQSFFIDEETRVQQLKQCTQSDMELKYGSL